jgi:Protein of Unknown function (DUF2784)
MLYSVLADGVVLLHFLWILFLIFGGIWGRKMRGVRLVHVPALFFALLLEIFNWYCPLTYLEVWLRERGGAGGGYPGSFIPHYLERIVYIGIDRRVVVLLTLMVVGGNLLLYSGRKRT